MYVMTGEIVFPELKDRQGGTLVIRHFQEVMIEQTFKQFTQFAEIVIARKLMITEDQDLSAYIKVGTKVEIHLGYNGDLVKEFEGYVTRVSANIPVVIRVEDEMWKAKRIPVNYVGANLTLERLLKDLVKDYEVEALEVEVGDVRFSQTNLGAVLEKLESEWKLYSYFDGKKLVCGKYYARHTDEVSYIFNMERNVVNDSLNYRKKEDVILKIDATSILANGDKITFSMGDEGGDVMTLAYYNIKVEAELEKKVKEDYERAKLGGFEGIFTAFGIPSVAFGRKLELSSDFYGDRNGDYYIEGVKKTFSNGGYRQEIRLGGLVS